MAALKNELNVTLGVLAVNLARVVLVADGVAEFVDDNYKKLDCVLRQVEVGVASVQDAPTRGGARGARVVGRNTHAHDASV